MEKPVTLREWQAMFGTIYGDRNSKVPFPELWLHLMEEAGQVAEDLRKEKFKRLSYDLPDVFAWLCAFANKYSVDLSDVVWNKFPAVCPYCEREEHCICIAGSYPDYEPPRLNDFRLRADKKPEKFEGWENMFRKIYGNVNRTLPYFAIGFHLMEEIGEVAKEIRVDDREKCKEELADVFAWIIGMVLKVQLDFNDFVFTDELWATYPGICKDCKNEKCNCKVRPTLEVIRE